MELAVIIALAPTIALSIYIYQKDRHDREPVSLLLKLFLFGALSVIPVFIVERILTFFNFFRGILSALFTAFIVAGLTEEYFKRLVVIKAACRDKHYDEKLDGIVYCVFSALGFATIENLLYVIRGLSNFVYTGISRGVFAVPAHMLFGITMGYYLSLSKFARDEKSSRLYLKRSYFVPVLLHGTYDFILLSRFTNLLVVFVIFVLFLWKISLDKLNEYTRDSRIRNRG